MPTPQRLSVLDELFLHLEGPSTHMHLGCLALFEGPAPDWQETLEAVRGRLPLVPRFRQKLAEPPHGLGRPSWVDDPHFDLAHHVHRTALPAPGDDGELKRLTAKIMSQQLDRAKPLWEMCFVEGLAEGRFAIVSKTHHCVVDGVSAADILSVMMDPDPGAKRGRSLVWEPHRKPAGGRPRAQPPTSAGEVGRSVRSAFGDPDNLPAKLVGGIRALSAFVGGTLDFAPASSLNAAIGPQRVFETVLADLDGFKQVKSTLGGTINDTVLSVVAGGLRHLLRSRGESVEALELRALVPVSVRVDASGTGNRLAALWAPLPVWEDDPERRLHLIRERMSTAKASGQAAGAQVLRSIGEHAPSAVLAAAALLVAHQRAYNLVVTNVPGPQIPLYMMGRRMEQIYPVLPLSENTTLGVALLSYNGTIGFGFLGDRDTASDLEVLAEGVEKSIAQLMAVVS